MHKYFKPVEKIQVVGSSSNDPPLLSGKRQCVELSDDDDIIGDPGKRKQIGMYPIALQDDIRRRYLLKGPCQPKGHLYPLTVISGKDRSFQVNWFSLYPWLEYSVSKDAAFCLYCFLFAKGNRSGDKAFTEIGFRNWKKGSENLQDHVGGLSSPHHYATVITEKARKLLNHGPKTHFLHFNKEIFVEVIARLIIEFDSRFSETNTEIVLCMACLDPTNAFENFDHQRVLRLAELYSEDFSYCDLSMLKEELKHFICEMRSNETFSTMEDVAVLAKKMVELKYHSLFPFTYRLIELILILPVATASVERSFSAMKLIKTDLRNKMGDDFLKDCMLCNVEKRIFVNIETEAIVRNFQAMAVRRNKLPRNL